MIDPDISDARLVVGVLTPPRLHHDESDALRSVELLRSISDSIEILYEPYEEPSQLRTRRSAPGYVAEPSDRLALSDAQTEVLVRSHVLLALDLPLDTPSLAPRLRWVQAIGTGTGHLRSAGLSEAGVILTNGAGTAAREIAEFVLARTLEHLKRLGEIRAAQDVARWEPLYGRPARGCTIGLVGTGSVNRAVAGLAQALGMRVLGCRRNSRSVPADFDKVYGIGDLVNMVRRCDVVVSALPETPETQSLFGAEVLSAMKPGSLFCNVGRGSVVDEQALLHALGSGPVAHAALDVFAEEPLPAHHPFWQHPGVSISAHCSSVPSASIRAVYSLFRDNLERYLQGLPLRNVVDRDSPGS